MQPEDPSASSSPRHPGAPDDVTSGSPSGDHRVLAPSEAGPRHAEQLDAIPDLWDAEARVDLEAVVLTAAGLAELKSLFGGAPERVRAALLTASAERGALGGVVADATLLGTVDGIGRSRPDGPGRPGERVAVTAPAGAVPTWLRDISGWDGHGRVVPSAGHAVVAADQPLVVVPQALRPLEAATLAELADVPVTVTALTPPGGRIVVLDATSVAGALAALAARRAGARRVVGLVASLQEARLARRVGVDEPVVGPPGSVTTAALLHEALGTANADLVVVAGGSAATDVSAGSLAARLTRHGTVLALDADLGRELVADARAVGSRAVIRIDRTAGTGRTPLVFELFDGSPEVASLLRWRIGTGPAPSATMPEDP